MELPRSGYKILRLIIIGYLHQGGSDRNPASYEQVGNATSVNPTMVSGNNKALEALGIVERHSKRGSYRLTPDGFELARALEFEEPELTKRALQPLLTRNETISTALNALRTRGPMAADDFAAHLVLVAGGRNTKLNMTGARTIIEMLALADLVEQGPDDSLQAVRKRDSGETPADLKQGDAGVSSSDEEQDEEPAIRSPVIPSGLVVHINVSLEAADLTDDDTFDRILERLAQLRDMTE